MAAPKLGRSILKYVYDSSSLYNRSPAQLVFSRGFASMLFVKGIPFSTREEGLANAFSQFGKVVEAKVIMNKTKTRSKGYGYVTFAEEEAAEEALKVMNGNLLEGRIIFVDREQPSFRGSRNKAADE